MDNIQVPVQDAPQGQAEPTGEQVPDVQTGDAMPEGQESPEETTFQDLAAKKGFKSPDDLAKAYANLESHSTKVSQDKAKLEREFFTSAPAKVEPLKAMNPDEQALAELDKFVKERTQAEIQQIRAEFKEREDRKELRETIEKNPDFGKYAQDVKEIKRQYSNMPFPDALLMAKAQKGDLAVEARKQGMSIGAKVGAQQQNAQVAPTKSAQEKKGTVQDLLKDAGQRWKIPNTGIADPKAVAEIEEVERQLFGYVLPKTDSGL